MSCRSFEAACYLMVIITGNGCEVQNNDDENTFQLAGFLLDSRSCLLNMCIILEGQLPLVMTNSTMSLYNDNNNNIKMIINDIYLNAPGEGE